MRNRFMAIMLSIALLSTTSLGVESMSVKAATSTTLTVDCGSTIREATHCASGSLYGVTETTPSDISLLVNPLNPNVFTNPARAGSGYQQNIGAAIDVAERLTDTSSQVMIRLADICPNWPYTFPGMSSWLSQVTSVIQDKLASNANNFYGYEIWNEPVYTWNTSNGTFYNMWSKTYALIRSLDPNAKIVGPSEGYYNHDIMYGFLSYCVTNNCVPDIICWHELSSDGEGTYVGDIANNIKDYRAIETSLGLSDLPISINEYCDIDHSKEGCPGSSACMIAKFERYEVDSACISWWWTSYPGRLGSLLASDSQKGAGWWFYKWYGDMSGNMVNVTPPDENSTTVDGFACVDSSEQYISCLLGGDNDGAINATFNNIPSWIGDNATVKVETVDWTNKDTVSMGPYTVEAANYTVSNGSIDVSLSNCNSTAGYRIYITPGIDSSTVRYEAEDATLTNANIFSNSNASGGAYVGQIDYNDSTTPKYSYVDFMVNAAQSGTYNMTICYANGSGATATQGLAYNNGAWSNITYPETSGWAQFNTTYTQVELVEGINVIRLAKGSPYFDGGSNYAELDYLEFEYLSE